MPKRRRPPGRRRWSTVRFSFQGEEASPRAYRRSPSCRPAANPDRSSQEISGGVVHCSMQWCPIGQARPQAQRGRITAARFPIPYVRSVNTYQVCLGVCCYYYTVPVWKRGIMEILYSIEQYAHFFFVLLFYLLLDKPSRDC